MQVHNYFESPGEENIEAAEPQNSESAVQEEAATLETEDEEPREFASPAQALKALDEAFRNDKDLYDKLVHHANKWLYKYKPAKKKLGANTPNDMVRKAIEKIISGDRRWNYTKTPRIENLLLMAIVSEIRNKIKKKKPPIGTINLYNRHGELKEENNFDLIRSYLRADIFEEEESEKVEEWITGLQNYFESKNDIETYCVLEELLEIDRTIIQNPTKHIAEQLKIPVTEVKNAIRKIKRRTHLLLNHNK